MNNEGGALVYLHLSIKTIDALGNVMKSEQPDLVLHSYNRYFDGLPSPRRKDIVLEIVDYRLLEWFLRFRVL